MTDQLTLPLFPKRSYALYTDQAGTYYHSYDLTAQEARQYVQDALDAQTLSADSTEHDGLLAFVGALTLGLTGRVLVSEYSTLLPCECCSDPTKDFVVVT